jgi:hypothetical protein
MSDHRERLGPAALLLLAIGGLALAGLVCQGCRTPPPGSPGTGQRIVDCTTQAVADTWPEAMGPVNSCLANTGATGCLLALIAPAGQFAESLIACLVRNQGATYAHASQANPADVASKRAADNARAFIQQRGYVFEGAR